MKRIFKRTFKRIWLRLYRMSARLGLDSLFFRASYASAALLLGSRRVQQVFFPKQVGLVQTFLQRTGLETTHPVTPTVRQVLYCYKRRLQQGSHLALVDLWLSID